jgi:hypothetical protein
MSDHTDETNEAFSDLGVDTFEQFLEKIAGLGSVGDDGQTPFANLAGQFSEEEENKDSAKNMTDEEFAEALGVPVEVGAILKEAHVAYEALPGQLAEKGLAVVHQAMNSTQALYRAKEAGYNGTIALAGFTHEVAGITMNTYGNVPAAASALLWLFKADGETPDPKGVLALAVTFANLLMSAQQADPLMFNVAEVLGDAVAADESVREIMNGTGLDSFVVDVDTDVSDEEALGESQETTRDRIQAAADRVEAFFKTGQLS